MKDAPLTSKKVLSVLMVFTVLLAALAALLSTFRQTAEYSPTSPEGVIQLYLQSVIDGKNDNAAEYFSVTSKCTASDIDRSWMPEAVRINLIDAEVNADKAYVEVAVDISSGGPFDDYYTENHKYRLIRESENWKIEGIPWPLYSCGEINK
jgi:hypothetical protein